MPFGCKNEVPHLENFLYCISCIFEYLSSFSFCSHGQVIQEMGEKSGKVPKPILQGEPMPGTNIRQRQPKKTVDEPQLCIKY